LVPAAKISQDYNQLYNEIEPQVITLLSQAEEMITTLETDKEALEAKVLTSIEVRGVVETAAAHGQAAFHH
jgi:hypothetical protein